MWKLVPVGAVLTAMVAIPLPTGMETRQADAPEASPVPMSSLRLETVTPTFGLSRTPLHAYVTARKPLEGVRILIDPGHGGQALQKKGLYTGGTVGVATGQTESDVNLRVSLCLRQYLQAAGATVIMTRISDNRCTRNGSKSEELDYRSNLANRRNCDFFISVHHNEGQRRDANYTICFVPSGMPKAISLGENVASAVSRYLGTENLGARYSKYRVLRGIKMPGIICEASFMSNKAEDRRLASLSYNKKEAKAIATGILNYVKLTKGRSVDFNTIFAPIDDQSATAQAYADASFIRRKIIERRSLFGVRYEEVTYNALGRVIARRSIGRDSLAVQRDKAKKSSGKKVASKSKKSKSKK
jgi:N-acetylmuramoyl-L-alanine amidase